MENKRLYKKIDTYFWFFMMSLPILFAVIVFIFSFARINVAEGDNFIQSILSDFYTYFPNSNSIFDDLTFTFIYNMFSNLFDLIGINSADDNVIFITSLCSYWVSLGFIHLIVDICLWLPNLFHKWLNKERF